MAKSRNTESRPASRPLQPGGSLSAAAAAAAAILEEDAPVIASAGPVAPAPESAPDATGDEGGGEKRKGPMPALFPTPAVLSDIAQAPQRDSFVFRGGLVDLLFIRRSDVLLVTFDNLGSLGEYEPPQPWMQGRAAKAGFSILGLMASRGDWYRNPDAPALIRGLRAAGFFAQFRRVVFTGASMGGYAALTLSSLVPGSVVLAFSPQSTLAKDLVPFETRYRYGGRKWDWTSPELLDGASTIAEASEVYVVFDPFVSGDRAHANRLVGPQVETLRAPVSGHRAIRQIKAFGFLQDLIEAVGEGRFSAPEFRRAMRVRRTHTPWLRALLTRAEEQGHRRLALAAARRAVALDETNRYARRLARRLRQEMKDEAAAAKSGAEGKAPGAPSRPDKARKSPQGDSRVLVTNPPPIAPFTGEILSLADALLIPEREHDQPHASGVLHSDGRWCELSKAWIRARKSTPAPTLAPDEVVTELPGTHLFGGHFRGHFGHFLVESTARLWALDHLGEKPESILYLPYRGDVQGVERAIRGQQKFFDLIGIDIPVRTFGGSQRVERLIVPELGFGWLDRYAGSPAYRAFMQTRLGAAAQAEGAEKLYVSRARLNPQRGGILGETVIEENLARLGYEIFHPEKHPLEVQIARYKAARQIVALDGSALHLAAYVLGRGAKVAMILRRSMANVADYDLQFRNFCGVTPDVINVIRRDWVAGGATRADYRSIGEIDFAALFTQLQALGYVPQDFRPEIPDEAETRALLDAFEDRRGQAFRALVPGERHEDEEE